MNIEKNTSEISDEISATLKLMKKAKTPEEKLKYSVAVKNLCSSMEVFFNFFESISPFDHFDDELDELDDDDDDKNFSGPIPF